MESYLIEAYNSEITQASEPKKILIVENEPIWQLIIQRTLQLTLEGAEVHTCASVEQALEAIEGDLKFDLIIADHLLDGALTGLDLWDLLVSIQSVTHFVLMSGIARSDFYYRLMPYRREMVPQFIEKVPSVRELYEKMKDANLF